MASVFKVFGITGDAKEWYAQQASGDVQWEYDDALSCYCCGNIFLKTYDDCASFDPLDILGCFDQTPVRDLVSFLFI